MYSKRNVGHSNQASSNTSSASTRSNTVPSDNRLATDMTSQDFNHRINTLEELINNRLKNESIQIKELQDRIEKLEEKTQEYQMQIKILEEKVSQLQCRDAIPSGVKSVSESERDDVDQRQLVDLKVNGSMSKSQDDQDRNSERQNILNTFDNNNARTTLNSENGKSAVQVRSTISEKGCDNIVQDQDRTRANESKGKINLSENNKTYSTASFQENSTHSRQTGKSLECSNNSSTKGRCFGSSNFMFTSWMNSRKKDFSIWSNTAYKSQLLSYIGKIYGQTKKIYQLIGPLDIEHNESDELDQLYDIIKRFEKEHDAKQSLIEWRQQNRSNRRLVELKTIFEYNSVYSKPLRDLTISLTSDSQEILIPGSVKAYFDMLGRNSSMAADIGEYFKLKKENIFNGDTCDCHNERITFVNVDLNESTIDLDDNRVDLVTCLVTLHHVPHLQPILSEIVRILRPGGYLILREHDCKNVRSLQTKYLNFVHAFMMIARIDDFANVFENPNEQKYDKSNRDADNNVTDWKKQRAEIIKSLSSIQYRTRDEWQKELEDVGFHQKAVVEYNPNNGNPQALYYAVYQLNTKK